MKPDIRREVAHHLQLKEQLLAVYPELEYDEQALLDTLSGETNLHDQLIVLLNSAEDDRAAMEGIMGRINQLSERHLRLETRMTTKRKLALQAMIEAGIKRLEAPEFTASLTQGQPSVVITDETKLPAGYLRHPKPVPDKATIAAALKLGDPVPGATLSNAGPHLQIRRS